MGTHNWSIAAAEPVRLASSSCCKTAIMPRSLLLSLACISCLPRLLARRPPVLGWSTWNSFGCGTNSTLIEESIQAMSNSPLHAAGYDHIMIDDCWAACSKIDPSSGHCLEVAPRGADGRIIPDPQKFPNGFRPLTDLARSLGLHLGIYTSVGSLTCAGYMGSMGHEALDANTFINTWGFDFIKHDTCGLDYSVHDGSMQEAVQRMRDGIWAASQVLGTPITYYLDTGNPTSPQRLFNPRNIGVTNKEALLKLATRPDELGWVWATRWERERSHSNQDDKGPHMIKTWFDQHDSWSSMLSNAHNAAGRAEYQSCSQLMMPDMLTIGMGHQKLHQYYVQMALWVVLGAPLILGNDIRHMDASTITLVTNAELLAINQDSDCVQGSLVRFDDGSCETWIKPLNDSSLAAVLLNKGSATCNCSLFFDCNDDSNANRRNHSNTIERESTNLRNDLACDLYPASWSTLKVRDVLNHVDMGVFHNIFTTTVGASSATMFRLTPSS